MPLIQPKGHSSMKPIMTVSLYLVMAAVFVTLALPGPLAAKEQVPFKGSVQGREFIAANGDVIFTTIVGQGEPTDTPGINRIVEINTITGGTGRFAGAKGSFTLERLVDLTTGSTSGSFHGTITSPGAAH
jgi:hypothetical protein